MACDRLRDLALLDVDDALDPAERAELDLHLATCAECRAARDGARLVSRGVRQLPVPPVPLGFSERTLQRIDRAQSVAPRPGALRFRIAAAAAILIGVAVYWVEREQSKALEGRRDLVATRDAGAGAPGWKEQAPSNEKARVADQSDDAPPPPSSAAAPVAGGKLEQEADGDKNKNAAKDRDAVAEDAKLHAGKAGAPVAPGAPPAAIDSLVRELASGTPADALRRLGEYAGGVKEEERRQAEVRAETEKSEPPEKAADFEAKKSPEAAPTPPPLRFLRAHGDAARVASVIGARGDALAHDATNRLVLELTEEEAKALETRLAIGGIRVETLAPSDWFAALREAADRERLRSADVVAKGDVRKTGAPSEPASAKPAVTSPAGKLRGGLGSPGAGASKRKGAEPAAAPRVRWIVLAGE